MSDFYAGIGQALRSPRVLNSYRPSSPTTQATQLRQQLAALTPDQRERILTQVPFNEIAPEFRPFFAGDVANQSPRSGALPRGPGATEPESSLFANAPIPTDVETLAPSAAAAAAQSAATGDPAYNPMFNGYGPEQYAPTFDGYGPVQRPATRRSPSVNARTAVEVQAPAPAPTPGATPPADPAATPPAEDRSQQERELAFAFGMASSRNPSLFGQFGEAGRQMLATGREQRQDALKSREIDVAQEYRRAVVDVQRAQLAWEQNPRNPRTIAALSEANSRAASIGLAAARLAREEDPNSFRNQLAIRELGIRDRAAREPTDNIVPGQYFPDEQGNALGFTRSGQVRPLLTPSGQPVRIEDVGGRTRGQAAEQVWETGARAARQSAQERLQRLRDSPLTAGQFATDQQRQQFLEDDWNDYLRRFPRPGSGQPAAGGTAPAPASRNLHLDERGNPVR